MKRGKKLLIHCAAAVLVLSLVCLGFGIYENIHCHKTAAQVTYVKDISDRRFPDACGEVQLIFDDRGITRIDFLLLYGDEMNRFKKGDEIEYFYYDDRTVYDMSLSDNAPRDMILRTALPGVCAAAAFKALRLSRGKQRGTKL